jgi:hypothetical protein
VYTISIGEEEGGDDMDEVGVHDERIRAREVASFEGVLDESYALAAGSYTGARELAHFVSYAAGGSLGGEMGFLFVSHEVDEKGASEKDDRVVVQQVYLLYVSREEANEHCGRTQTCRTAIPCAGLVELSWRLSARRLGSRLLGQPLHPSAISWAVFVDILRLEYILSRITPIMWQLWIAAASPGAAEVSSCWNGSML